MEKQSGGVTNQNEKSSKKSSASDVQKFTADFRDTMDADLNVSAALAAVHECMSYMNSHSAPTTDVEIALKEFIELVRNTFGCFEAEAVLIPAAVQALAAERLAARAAKDFAESDRLRDEIAKLGWMVRDTKGEQEVRKI
jgi:cysteinyl-tRNA synthetase